MKKPGLSPALGILVLFAALLPGVWCGGSHGGAAANLTVIGTVFCDACSSSSFSNYNYFLSGVKVRLDCTIKVNSSSKEEIKITAEKVTNSYGAYQLDIPAIDGLPCEAAAESFCRAAVLDNPSALCNVPAVNTTTGHIALPSQEPNACFYSLNSLYYRPGRKRGPGQCDAAASAAHPVLHAAPVVPTHTLLHAPAAGVPVPAAADTGLHATVASPAGVPFPATAVAVGATTGAATAVVSVSTFAADLFSTVTPATAAAGIPVPFAAVSAATSSPTPATIAITVVAAPSAATATATATAVPTVVSLAVPATTFLPSRFFWAISSTCEVYKERSKHLVLFQQNTIK